MINRYLEKQIKRLLKGFPAIGILGPRQVGKTTLAKSISKYNQKKYIYLDLEKNQDRAKITNIEFYLETNKDKCIILDEIQLLPEIFPILRSSIDEYRNPGRFILLGSASPEILRHSSETLAGRIAFKELTPLNLLEIHKRFDQDTHWLRGGFPIPLIEEDGYIRNQWYDNYIKAIIERELPKLGLNTDRRNLSRFFNMLGSCQGEIMNMSNFSKSLSISHTTINRYFYYLENGYFIRILRPYFTNIKKRIVKSSKVYIRDTGLLNSILNIKHYNDLLGHIKFGHLWETYVIEQILSITNGQYEAYFYRTQDGTECDLVLQKGIQPIYSIEIKFTKAPKKTKSFCNCIKDLNTTKNFIIVPDTDQVYKLDDNIIVCDLMFIINDILKSIEQS